MAAPVVAVKLNAGEKEAILQKLETEKPEIVQVMQTITINSTSKYVYSGEQKLWSGTQGNNPIPIPPGDHTLEKHTGPTSTGVRYGRVYYNAKDELPTTRKFIIAFDSLAHKVYAETGPYGPVDWNVVEDLLSKSGNQIDVTDPILGGRILGVAHENGNGYVEFMDGITINP